MSLSYETKTMTREWKREDDALWEHRQEKWLEDSMCCEATMEVQCDTEEWIEGRDGRWLHSGYGPVYGWCPACGRPNIDTPDGGVILDLPSDSE